MVEYELQLTEKTYQSVDECMLVVFGNQLIYANQCSCFEIFQLDIFEHTQDLELNIRNQTVFISEGIESRSFQQVYMLTATKKQIYIFFLLSFTQMEFEGNWYQTGYKTLNIS